MSDRDPQVYVYNTFHRRRDFLWSSRCPLCAVQFLKPDVLESFHAFADHIKVAHPISTATTSTTDEKLAASTLKAHVAGLKCDRCGFTFSAHADGYCPDGLPRREARFVNAATGIEA